MGKLYPFCIFGGDANIEKSKYGDVQKWLPIKDIKNNIIVAKGGEKVKLFKVEPINFELKSEGEQRNILESYKAFLKNYNSDMQIIVQTDSIDLEEHIKKMEAFKKEKEELTEMVNDYIKMVLNISQKRESISRKFYIVTKLKNEKVIKNLEQCGNRISECDDIEIVEILKRYFKKEAKMRKEAKWV